MDARWITDDYAVAPQIAPTDVAEIAQAGYATVICNRPDGEVPPELQAEALRQAVEAAGLAFVVNPVTHGGLDETVLATQAEAMAQSAGPVLAYCASGNRCAMVWSLIEAPRLGADAVLAATRAAGYDHSMLRPQLEAIAKG